jgi:hypothetical protein
MPITVLTLDLTIGNNTKAIKTCELWDLLVYLLPQNKEKILPRWMRPELTTEKSIMGGVCQNRFMIIAPAVCLTAFCNHP